MYKKDKFKPAIKNTVENSSIPDILPEDDSQDRQQIKGTKRMKNARYIEINKIKPDPNQPRKAIPQNSLKELADSILQHNVLQPIIVEYIECDDYYQIISGERRFLAAKIAKLTEIPCIIYKDVDSQNRYAKQLIENLQREDLSPIDKARALLEYKDLLGPKSIWKDVEKIVGISKSRRKQYTALLNLPENIQKEVVNIGRRPSNNNITEKHARALLILNKHPEKQFELFKFIKDSKKQISGDEAINRAKRTIGKKSFNNQTTITNITEAHLKALTALNNYPQKQKELLEQIIHSENKISGAEAIERVNEIKGNNKMRVFRIEYKTDDDLIEGLQDLVELTQELLVELKEQYVTVE